MRMSLSVCLLLAAAAIAGAEPPGDDELRSYADRSLVERASRADFLEGKLEEERAALKRAKRGRINPQQRGSVSDPKGPKPTFQSKEAKESYLSRKQETIDRIEALRRDLENLSVEYFADFEVGPIAQGAIGRFSDERAYSVQVIDAKNMIAKIHWRDRENAVPIQLTVWLANYPTEGVADGKQLSLEVPFVVSGTKQYATVTGATKTLFLLEPVDLDSLRNLLARHDEK